MTQPNHCGFLTSYETMNSPRKTADGEKRYFKGDGCQNPSTHELVRKSTGNVEHTGCWIHVPRYARQQVGWVARRIQE